MSINRREFIAGGAGVAAGAVPAIFGGRYSEPGAHPAYALVQANYGVRADLSPMPMMGRCGGCHIGNGIVISAGHCVSGKGIKALHVNGGKLTKVAGREWAFVPDSYVFPGDDFALIYDPALVGAPAARVAPKEVFIDLRGRVARGERPEALIVGKGTTRLDEYNTPTASSERLKELDVVIAEMDLRRFGVVDPTGEGRGCQGDSGGPCFYEGYTIGATTSVPQNNLGQVCTDNRDVTTYTSLEGYLPLIRDFEALVRAFA